jgi:putative ABC transport system ATP-binding protein
MNVIELKAVKKDYPLGNTVVHAVKGVDLTIKGGDLLSIVGPSGSGKTTLLNIIGCIDQASEGAVTIHGEDIRSLNDRQLTDLRLHRIGFIFQTFNLIPVLTVRENVEFPLLLMKRSPLSAKEIRERVEQLVEEVGLKDQIQQRPYELSGGQRQRVAIARALVTKPDIVLADEPTANLDSATGEKILELMKELNEIENTTFIFSTHDRKVMAKADRLVTIEDGRIGQLGVRSERGWVLVRPRHSDSGSPRNERTKPPLNQRGQA